MGKSAVRLMTLAAVHNRKEKTLSALSSIKKQVVSCQIQAAHMLVDDGSADGTADQIEETFPDVEVIKGDGCLYWSGGMRVGWDHIKQRGNFDYLLVYNDDVNFFDEALGVLLSVADTHTMENPHKLFAVVGSFCSADKPRRATYGGQVRSSNWHPLRFVLREPHKRKVLEADTCNMNAVLIPFGTLDSIGFLSPQFLHRGADFEWGLRLTSAGGALLCAPGFIGVCERNVEQDSFIERSTSLFDCYKRLFGPKKMPFRERLYLYRKYGGILWHVLFLIPYVTTVFKYYFYRIKK